MPCPFVVLIVNRDDLSHCGWIDLFFFPPVPPFPLHGIPEHLLAGVDPGLAGVGVGDGRLLPGQT